MALGEQPAGACLGFDGVLKCECLKGAWSSFFLSSTCLEGGGRAEASEGTWRWRGSGSCAVAVRAAASGQERHHSLSSCIGMVPTWASDMAAGVGGRWRGARCVEKRGLSLGVKLPKEDFVSPGSWGLPRALPSRAPSHPKQRMVLEPKPGRALDPSSKGACFSERALGAPRPWLLFSCGLWEVGSGWQGTRRWCSLP